MKKIHLYIDDNPTNVSLEISLDKTHIYKMEETLGRTSPLGFPLAVKKTVTPFVLPTVTLATLDGVTDRYSVIAISDNIVDFGKLWYVHDNIDKRVFIIPSLDGFVNVDNVVTTWNDNMAIEDQVDQNGLSGISVRLDGKILSNFKNKEIIIEVANPVTETTTYLMEFTGVAEVVVTMNVTDSLGLNFNNKAYKTLVDLGPSVDLFGDVTLGVYDLLQTGTRNFQPVGRYYKELTHTLVSVGV